MAKPRMSKKERRFWALQDKSPSANFDCLMADAYSFWGKQIPPQVLRWYSYGSKRRRTAP